VTGDAFKLRTAVARKLPANHIETYPAEVQPIIAPNLKCVLAVPIFDPGDPPGPLLGILAFDSFESIKTIGFDSRESKLIAQSWADLVSEVIVL
jgi:hypothetical protein